MHLVGDLDPELPYRRMIQKKSAERLVILSLHHFTDVTILADRYRLAAAGAMEREPAPAGFEPTANEIVLLVIRIRARDVGDEEVAVGQPLQYVGIVVSGGRQQLRIFLQHAQQPQPHVVHVVAGERSGRIAARDKMDANRFGATHRTTPSR